RQAPLLAKRGRLPLLYALYRARVGAGARYDPKEEQRSLCHGSRKRPGRTARLLPQLDDPHGQCLRGGSTRVPCWLAATRWLTCRLEVDLIAPHRVENARQ